MVQESQSLKSHVLLVQIRIASMRQFQYEPTSYVTENIRKTILKVTLTKWHAYCLCPFTTCQHLANARMLNIWLNINNNCSMKKIKIGGMSCNSLWIPAFVL